MKLYKYENEDANIENVNIDLEANRQLEPILKEKNSKKIYICKISLQR